MEMSCTEVCDSEMCYGYIAKWCGRWKYNSCNK